METVTCSIADARRATGLGRTKIDELLKNGTLKSVKVGTRRLVTIASIRALADQAA